MPKISPLAPAAFPVIPPIDGVRFASGVANIRYKDRVDLFYAELVEGTTVAGVFARSSMPSAAVDWCRHAMVDGDGRARALVVNSGNANAFTGRQGAEAARGTAEAAARIAGTRSGEVFVSSTGVIGEPLPYERIVAKLPDLKAALGTARGDEWEAAARAISTTDTFPKGAVRTASIGGVPVTIAGICKGSGMIAPNMGTMLGYVFTDAQISSGVLQHLLTRAADKSFNAITVDSDASTNDTVLAFATGRAKHPWVAAAGDAHFRDFRRKFDEVMLELAHQIVKDGEGATKFVTVTVTGAAGAASAKRIGLAIANSPLVKTAIAGEDANWGRVVMAVGKSGEKADRDKLAISIGGTTVAADGAVVPGYDEAPVAQHMKGQDIVIEVDVGVGAGKATVWTCDLTHGYIDINGSYRS
jgi:glutamate N-acetyltransferase/amino-acid N-acetyltransferase